MEPLSQQQAEALLAQLDGWVLNQSNSSISLKKSFKNFAEAQAYVNRVGELAEAENHHPDILFGWGYATIMLTTHAINGLSENDFILAAKIDEIAS